MQDQVHNIAPVTMIGPAVYTTTEDGTYIDLAGFESATIIIQCGGVAADETMSVKLKDSDTTSGFADVTEENTSLIGDYPVYAPADAASIKRFGYIGGKRYIQVVCTIAGTTPEIALAAICVKGNGRRVPLA